MSKANLKPIVTKLRASIIKGISGKLEKYGFDDMGKLVIDKPLSSYDENKRSNLIALFEAKKINNKKQYTEYIHNSSRTFLHILICFKLMEKRGIMRSLISKTIGIDIYNEIIPDFVTINPMAYEEFVKRYEKEISKLAEEDNSEECEEYYQFLYLISSLKKHMASEVPLLFGDYEYSIIQPDYDDLKEILYVISQISSEEYEESDFFGWIYQYWVDVTEKEVKEAKKNKSVSYASEMLYLVLEGLEDEQATYGEYYTPRWVVKYIVDKSLEMYEASGDKKIEEIKLLDPACGAGNFLVYAFDAFYERYERIHPEWKTEEIVNTILAKNIYGVDIQREPLQVSAINLWIKAKEKNINIDVNRLNLTKVNILCTNSLYKWESEEEYRQISIFDTPESLEEKHFSSEDIGKLLLAKDGEQRNTAIGFFQNKYEIIVMNPPYLGLRRMKKETADFLKQYYPDNYNNLFEAFVIRANQLLDKNGICGFVGSDTFLTLDSFDNLRMVILRDFRLKKLIKLGINVFDGPTVRAAILMLQKNSNNKSNYVECIEADEREPQSFENYPVKEFKMKQEDFKLITGYPFIYEFTDHIREIFNEDTPLGNVVEIKQGMITGDNKRFLRYKWEIPSDLIGKRFYPYAKGGGNEKWSNNIVNYIDWENDGKTIKDVAREKYGSETRTVKNQQYFFREGLTYSDVGSDAGGEDFSIRYLPKGCIFDVKGSCIFSNDIDMYWLLAFMNSKFVNFILSQLNPTPSFQVCDLVRIPYRKGNEEQRKRLIEIAKESYELKSYILGFDYLSDFYHDVEIAEGLKLGANTIHQAYEKYSTKLKEVEERLFELKNELDEIVYSMYGLTDDEIALINKLVNGVKSSALISIEKATFLWVKSIIKDAIIDEEPRLYLDYEIKNILTNRLELIFGKENGYLRYEEIEEILNKDFIEILQSGVKIDNSVEQIAGDSTKNLSEPILCTVKLGGKGNTSVKVFYNSQQFLLEYQEERKYVMQNEIRRLEEEIFMPKLHRNKEKLTDTYLTKKEAEIVEKEILLFEECIKTLENWKVVD